MFRLVHVLSGIAPGRDKSSKYDFSPFLGKGDFSGRFHITDEPFFSAA